MRPIMYKLRKPVWRVHLTIQVLYHKPHRVTLVEYIFSQQQVMVPSRKLKLQQRELMFSVRNIPLVFGNKVGLN